MIVFYGLQYETHTKYLICVQIKKYRLLHIQYIFLVNTCSNLATNSPS